MAHFLLLCSHTRALDEIGDTELTELAENPEVIPSYAWCDRCVTWQPVAELVTTPALPPSLHAFVQATDLEPMTDPSATAARTSLTVSGPRLDEIPETAGAEPRPGVEDVGVSVPSTPPTAGRHRSSSRSEQYAR
ncbi:hypothetical protein [Amycolatopsis antarctica]|uniref:hypothetical protein n=1 Tax=Amycolatopsis antarctica TaxID=1854586 RepID=UPI001055B5B5|nr:hypothetical protein [Amycolatopsis antarctica]